MSDVDAPARKGKPENRMALELGQALWAVQQGKGLPKTVEERKAAWKAAKPASIKSARALIKKLEKKGVALTKSAAAAPEAAEDDM